MMREILFRAKRLDNGEWVEGYYLQLIFFGIPIHMIAETDKSTCLNTFQIKPETLCQFTGSYDKDGERIWEGDCLLLDGQPLASPVTSAIIEWEHYGFHVAHGRHIMGLGALKDFVVTRLGSIHDREVADE